MSITLKLVHKPGTTTTAPFMWVEDSTSPLQMDLGESWRKQGYNVLSIPLGGFDYLTEDEMVETVFKAGLARNPGVNSYGRDRESTLAWLKSHGIRMVRE